MSKAKKDSEGGVLDYSLDARNARVTELLAEYQQCTPGSGANGWNRSADATATRFAEWSGQSADCKKRSGNGIKAMPWEGASDQRVFTADGLVDMQVDQLTTAFWRELVQAEGINADEAPTAGAARTMLRYFMRNRLGPELSREVELSAQLTHTFGACLLQVGWDRELGRRYRSVTLMDVDSFDPEGAYAVADPTRELEAMEVLRRLYEAYLAVEVAQMERDEVPDVSERDLRKYVKALREEGECQVALPFVLKNQPCVRALKLWQDVFLPEDLGDIQRTPVFVRELLRVDEVMSRVNTRGWDRDWAEAACAHKGHISIMSEDPAVPWQMSRNTQFASYVEIVTAYTRRLDEDEIPGVYVTTFCPAAVGNTDGEDLVAEHGLLEYAHGLMPFVALTTEWATRSITLARGIPERAAPAQRMLKVERDSQVDRASITTLPPRLVPTRDAGADDTFGPACTIPVTAGREPKFMALPQYDGVSDRVQAQTREDIAWQFAIPSPLVTPIVSSNRAQRHLNAFFQAWTEACHQMWQLSCQYTTDAEFIKVVGVPKPKSDEIAGRYGVMLAMDVRQLDSEYALKELEAISQHVLPEDAAGLIDRGQLVQMKLAALNPLLATRLVQGKQGASQKVYEAVATEIASMFLGNPPKLVENDPTAPMQLQFAQQIVQQNQKYQKALVEDAEFKKSAMMWFKNRQQSVVQQQNKMTGRLGVAPVPAM